MNGILNLSSDCEMGAHSITHLVGNLVNNGSMHGFIATIDRENVSFSCHGREMADISTLQGTDDANVKALFKFWFCCPRFGHVILHTSGAGRDQFSGVTRFLLGASHHVLTYKAKGRWFGLMTVLLVPSIQQFMAQDLC